MQKPPNKIRRVSQPPGGSKVQALHNGCGVRCDTMRLACVPCPAAPAQLRAANKDLRTAQTALVDRSREEAAEKDLADLEIASLKAEVGGWARVLCGWPALISPGPHELQPLCVGRACFPLVIF